jgi:thiaminase (transcriptional activator TenA)
VSDETGSASFQVHKPDPGFCEWLLVKNEAAWRAMIEHRFCRDLAADRLPEAAFLRYLRFEHAFVRAAISIFAYALAKAPTAGDQDHLVRVLNALVGEQEGYFRRAFTRLGVDPEPLSLAVLPKAARALHDGVLAIAERGSFAEILSAMLAAEWMYLTWCEQAHAESPRREAPADWIRLHVEPGFRVQVAWLQRRLEQLGPSLSPTLQDRCAEHFGRVLALEIAFHEAPYAEG